MGKFILCTSQNDYSVLKNNVKEYFEKSSESIGSFGYLCTFKKLRINTKNSYCFGNDFAAGVGTFFYNGKRDSRALKDILQDFNGDISELRKKVVGSYCLIIYKDKKMFLFVDPATTYNVYYHIDVNNNNIIATTTYYHVASICKDIEVDRYMFISEWLHSILRESTMFKNVYKLSGDKALVFADNKWNVESIEYSSGSTESDMIQKIKTMYSPLKDFEKTSIFLTGGQDSRLTLALLLSLNIKPLICYGRGNSSDTCTKQKDLDIVEEIANKFKLQIQYMDWSDSDQSQKYNYLRKYGELYTIYCMNKNFMREFEERLNTDFVCFGYFGEVFRTIESIENYNKEVFSLRDYMNDIYLAADIGLFKNDNYKEYSSRIYKLLLEICDQTGLNPEQLTKKDFQKLNTVYRQRWDTQLNNYANLFVYSCPLFGDKTITDIAEREEYENKLYSKYQMKLISQFKRDLLEIPFFSHIKTKKYNPETFELVDSSITSKEKDAVRSIIKSPRIIYRLKLLYYILQKDKKGLEEIRKEYKEKEKLRKQLNKRDDLLDNVIDKNRAVSAMDARRIKHLLLLKYLIAQIGKDSMK